MTPDLYWTFQAEGFSLLLENDDEQVNKEILFKDTKVLFRNFCPIDSLTISRKIKLHIKIKNIVRINNDDVLINSKRC